MTGRTPMHAARRSRVASWVVVAVVLGTAASVGAAVVSVDDAAEVSGITADRVEPPRRAVVIGDSAIAALRWVPNASNAVLGFDHVLDLESCRRLFDISCFGREGRQPPTTYLALDAYGDNFHTVIVATGYNDSEASFERSFRAVVGRARAHGYDRIVWYTLRSDVDYVSPDSLGFHQTFAANNATLARLLATGTFPDVVVADWNAYTADRPGWFATDGVHYRAVGAWAAADYLSRKMAYLDGRRCPLPISPSDVIEDPCPDPDVTGPLADIEALYPVGEEGLLCYEIGIQRRFECRFDTHVLELTRELAPGMTGSDVAALQIRLQRLGFLAAGVTGTYGPATTDAVAAFQTSAALSGSGVADVATLDALGFDVSALAP